MYLYIMSNELNMNYQAQHQSVTALYRSKVVDPSCIVKHRSGLYVHQNCPTSTYLSNSGRGVYEELSEGHTRTGNTEILTKSDLQPYNNMHEKATKGQFIRSTNLDPSTDWKVYHVDSVKVSVRAGHDRSFTLSVLHGNYTIID